MDLAPGGDVVIVVAVGDGAADHQQQDLGQRVGDAAHIARVGDGGEMLKVDRQAGFAGQRVCEGAHGRGAKSGQPHPIDETPRCHPLSHEVRALSPVPTPLQNARKSGYPPLPTARWARHPGNVG